MILIGANWYFGIKDIFKLQNTEGTEALLIIVSVEKFSMY